jgi:hypothetical protein
MTQAKDVSLEGVQVVKAGKSRWGQEMHAVLDSLPHKYVIMLHEDYFVTGPANREVLNNLITSAIRNDLDLLKMCGSWAGFVDDRKPLIPTDISAGPNKLWRYPNTRMYLISHQISIWKREFLRKTILPEYSPWDHELAGTDRIRAWHVPIYAYVGESPIPYTETMQRNLARSPGALNMILNAVDDLNLPPSKRNLYAETFQCA